jgi:hypothetical protein
MLEAWVSPNIFRRREGVGARGGWFVETILADDCESFKGFRSVCRCELRVSRRKRQREVGKQQSLLVELETYLLGNKEYS